MDAGGRLTRCESTGTHKLRDDLCASIEKKLEERRSRLRVRAVACPAARPVKRDDSFECRVTLSSGGQGDVRVVQTNDGGEVAFRGSGG